MTPGARIQAAIELIEAIGGTDAPADGSGTPPGEVDGNRRSSRARVETATVTTLQLVEARRRQIVVAREADKRKQNQAARAEAEALFAGFAIESFREEESDSTTPRGTAKHWHIFHAVARKAG